MEQLELIRRTVRRLERKEFLYFITGSIASSYHGIPRLTHDVDIVIAVDKRDIDGVIELFQDDGYISREGMVEALSGSGMFNFIDGKTGLKVDFWVKRDDPFTRSCFDRAGRVEIAPDFDVMMASAEDVFLHKLYWNRLMASERQVRDAQGILAVQGARLDLQYMREWAGELGVSREVEALLSDRSLPNLT